MDDHDFKEAFEKAFKEFKGKDTSMKEVSYNEYMNMVEDWNNKEKEKRMDESTKTKVKNSITKTLHTIVDKGPETVKKVGVYIYENREPIIGLVMTGVVLDNAISLTRWRRARTKKLKAEARYYNKRK